MSESSAALPLPLTSFVGRADGNDRHAQQRDCKVCPPAEREQILSANLKRAI